MAKKPEYGDITRHLLSAGGTINESIKGTIDKKQDKHNDSWTRRGLKPGETRTTFIVDEALLEQFKLVAYWEHSTIKDLIHEALEGIVSSHIKKHGPLQPKKKRR